MTIQDKANQDTNLFLPQVWYSQNKDYYIQSQQSIVEQLPVGVYELKKSPFGLKLALQAPEFTLPKKLYGITTPFIERVIKTWRNKPGNLGVLMWGLKGTSKTITAKIICNELKLPVIIVPFEDNRFPSFIEEISQDIIVFFDEFEKVFSNGNSYDDNDDENSSSNSLSSLLSLLDGTGTNKFRRFWIFTSNVEYVDRNLLDRPGRIRYCKEFKALDASMIVPIVDDLLKVENPERYDEIRLDLLATIGKLEFPTIDAVSAFVEEVNIHQELASELIGDFNLRKKLEKYMVYRQAVDENENLVVDPDKEGRDEELVGVYYPGQINITCFGENMEDNNFALKRKYEANVVRVLNQNQAIMRISLPEKYEKSLDKRGNEMMVDVNEGKFTKWLYTLEPVYSSLFDF